MPPPGAEPAQPAPHGHCSGRRVPALRHHRHRRGRRRLYRFPPRHLRRVARAVGAGRRGGGADRGRLRACSTRRAGDGKLSAGYRHGEYAASGGGHRERQRRALRRATGTCALRGTGAFQSGTQGPARSRFSRARIGGTPTTLPRSKVDSAKTSSPWGRGRLTSRPRRSSPRAGSGV